MICDRLSISFKKLDFETSNVSDKIIWNHHLLSPSTGSMVPFQKKLNQTLLNNKTLLQVVLLEILEELVCIATNKALHRLTISFKKLDL